MMISVWEKNYSSVSNLLIALLTKLISHICICKAFKMSCAYIQNHFIIHFSFFWDPPDLLLFPLMCFLELALL